MMAGACCSPDAAMQCSGVYLDFLVTAFTDDMTCRNQPDRYMCVCVCVCVCTSE